MSSTTRIDTTAGSMWSVGRGATGGNLVATCDAARGTRNPTLNHGTPRHGWTRRRRPTESSGAAADKTCPDQGRTSCQSPVSGAEGALNPGAYFFGSTFRVCYRSRA